MQSSNMQSNLSPHDRLFRVLMSVPEAVKEFLRRYLPERIRDAVNLETLEMEKDTFVDQHLKMHAADVLFSVDVTVLDSNGASDASSIGAQQREKSKGERGGKQRQQKGYIYILCEHQSNPDKMLPFRMHKYMINIMDFHLRKTEDKILPLVCPMIIYTGHRPYNYSVDIFDLFGENKELAKEVFLQPYKFISVQDIPDRSLRDFIYVGAIFLLFKNDDVNVIVRKIQSHLKVITENGEESFIVTIADYLVETKDIPDEKQFFAQLTACLSKNVEANVRTLAQRLREEGRESAMQEAETKVKTLAQRLREEGRESAMQEAETKVKTLAQRLREEGRESAMQKNMQLLEAAVLRMLMKGIDDKDIAEILSLPLGKIDEIKNAHIAKSV